MEISPRTFQPQPLSITYFKSILTFESSEWISFQHQHQHGEMSASPQTADRRQVRQEQWRQERPPVMAAASVFVSSKPELTQTNEAVNNYSHCSRLSKVPFYDNWAGRHPWQREKRNTKICVSAPLRGISCWHTHPWIVDSFASNHLAVAKSSQALQLLELLSSGHCVILSSSCSKGFRDRSEKVVDVRNDTNKPGNGVTTAAKP